MPRTILAAFTLCGLLLLPIHPVSRAQNGTNGSPAGSWEFTATPDPSTSAGAQFSGLATLTSDGSVIETDTSEPALRLTPGHGTWQTSPAAGRWFIRFTNLTANRNGSLRAKRILTLTMELNSTGDQFSGGYSFEIADPSGQAITTGPGTMTGQLMVRPLLP
jgi:hypothetical protein